MSAHLYLVSVLCKMVVGVFSICKYCGMHIHMHFVHLSFVYCMIPSFAARLVVASSAAVEWFIADMKSRDGKDAGLMHLSVAAAVSAAY